VDFSLEHECLPDGIAIIAVRGELNQYTSAKYRDLMIQLFKDGNRRLVVDLELCEFLDSTGLGDVVRTLQKYRRSDGRVLIVCNQERILKIFRITGLTKIFDIFSDVGSAVSEMSDSDQDGAGHSEGAPLDESR